MRRFPFWHSIDLLLHFGNFRDWLTSKLIAIIIRCYKPYEWLPPCILTVHHSQALPVTHIRNVPCFFMYLWLVPVVGHLSRATVRG